MGVSNRLCKIVFPETGRPLLSFALPEVYNRSVEGLSIHARLILIVYD